MDISIEKLISKSIERISKVDLIPFQTLLKIIAKGKYNSILNECEVPEGGFKSFYQFFHRRLKPNARAIEESNDTIISPCDGSIFIKGEWSSELSITVKGEKLKLTNFVPGNNNVEKGVYFGIYLSPFDYHGIASPITGEVTNLWYEPGKLFPVNRLGWFLTKGEVLGINEKVILKIKGLNTHLYMVIVGALGVSTIELDFASLCETKIKGGHISFSPHLLVKKGEELGRFRLGSTVVVFLEGDDWEFLKEIKDKVLLGEGIVKNRGINGRG